MTYRPGKVEGKPDGVDEPLDSGVGHVDRVVPEHRGGDVPEGAGRGGVDVGLVVLQAHPEAGPAGQRARRARRHAPAGAARAPPPPPERVVERLQSQLEQAGARHL